MAELLPAGDKIAEYDARVDPDAPPEKQKEIAEQRKRKHGILGRFSLLQLHVITLVVILSASGLVPAEDLAFVVLTSIYMFLMNSLVFKAPVSSGPPPNLMASNQYVMGKYLLFASFVGLVVPVGYVLGAFVYGDQKALKTASPHLFLLACQILSENVAFGRDRVSLPIRALIPIFYNTRRLFTLITWLKTDLNKGLESVGQHGTGMPLTAAQWILFGRALAASNLIVWTYNLFFFLLPVYLPRTFKKHYEMEAATTALDSKNKAGETAAGETKKKTT